ncbi:hypothetical protein QJS10_CPA01g00691 [Acorus calamus]|uniref:Toprim domain-containing protein n=1 Tax=Acorus calamus TaxID=4465 RepID=A0AAV9FLV8_ACOCL|nr:hypothetical protein QJS10_CPA01g00691 [Acorus calamus]
MGSLKHLFFPKCPHTQPSLINPRSRLHLTRHRLLFPNPLTGFLRQPATAHVFRSVNPVMLYRQVHSTQVEDEVVQDPLTLLRLKLEEEGIPSAGMKLDKFRTICPQLLTYFSGRMISGETLRRNAVLQHKNQNVIAFTYRRDGKLINCKYRDITKRMWQEKDTEKIFYGVDDIKDASDIIIVEGEIDKLSMEEAGFCNCVSVPCGAPSAVSKKALPSEEEDTGYQYLWSSKKYLEKASRIILATDADTPGQVLAEELARRLGRERCWRVTWPKKNENDVCKDANEVLMCFGPEALKNVIENAELYPIHGLFQIELRVGLVGEEAEVSKSRKRR